MLKKLIATQDDIAPAIARIFLGAIIFPHGAQKILGIWGGHGLDAAINAFGQWFGFPAFVTVLVALAEFAGALALILGLGARFMAGSIMLVMLGAIYFVVGKHFFMNWYGQPQYGEGFEFHLLALGLGLIVLLKGAGKYSLDALLIKRLDARQNH